MGPVSPRVGLALLTLTLVMASNNVAGAIALAEPHESHLEEIYYHRLNPPQGFAFQRVYTDDRSLDETVSVEDGDVVLVPKGYHPVGAPHGYDLYYLNVMAGPKRTWIFNNDPAHAWIAKKK